MILIKKILLVGFLIISNLVKTFGDDNIFPDFVLPEKLYIGTHGFLNSICIKRIKELPWICKNFKKEDIFPKMKKHHCNKNKANFALSHLLWQLAKIGLQYSEVITPGRRWFFNVKFYSFDYAIPNAFIWGGSDEWGIGDIKKKFEDSSNNKNSEKQSKKIEDLPKKENIYLDKHVCIMQKFNWASCHGGIEYEYCTGDNFSLCWSWAAGLSFPTGCPDIILIYTPFIFYHKNGFFCRLQLIQFSILNLASTIKYAQELKSADVEEKNIKNFCLKSVWNSILYNITLEVGYAFL